MESTSTVLPLENDNGSHVTVSTELASRDGLVGLFERAIKSSFLRRVYAQELKSLAEFVGGTRREFFVYLNSMDRTSLRDADTLRA